MSTVVRKLGNVFLTGLLAILPLYLTWRALEALFHLLESSAALWVEKIVGTRIVGAGALAVLLVVLFVGLVVTQIGAARFSKALDAIVERIPAVGRLYHTIRSLLDPLSKPESRPFREAVWVDVGEGMRVMGFVTSSPFREAPGDEDRVNVYLPMSHPYVGYVVTLPPDRLRPCPAAFDEVVTYHFSCGSAQPRAYREGEGV